MKTNFILALLLLLGTASHAQNTKKFTCKLNKHGRKYMRIFTFQFQQDSALKYIFATWNI